jgi:hypothetical protein
MASNVPPARPKKLLEAGQAERTASPRHAKGGQEHQTKAGADIEGCGEVPRKDARILACEGRVQTNPFGLPGAPGRPQDDERIRADGRQAWLGEQRGAEWLNRKKEDSSVVEFS